MRRFLMVLTAAVSGVLMLLGTAAAAWASAAPVPFCGIHWGSLPKGAGSMVQSPLIGVRAGEHPCSDRLVIDLGSGPAPGYRVQYVARLLADPSGRPIQVRGGATLRVAVLAPSGLLTVPGPNLVNVAGFRTFRQVVGAGSFEGISSIGVGVRARLPFRVFTLSGPGSHSRLVIDVAHLW